MRFVLDANVAVLAVAPQRVVSLLSPTRGALKPAARNFLLNAVKHRAELIVPPRFASEVTKAMTMAAASNVISWEFAGELLEDALSLKFTVQDPDYARVMQLTRLLNRKSSYDLEYAALAEALGCACVTADRPFVNAVRQLKGVRPDVVYVLKHAWA